MKSTNIGFNSLSLAKEEMFYPAFVCLFICLSVYFLSHENN